MELRILSNLALARARERVSFSRSWLVVEFSGRHRFDLTTMVFGICLARILLWSATSTFLAHIPHLRSCFNRGGDMELKSTLCIKMIMARLL